MKQFHRLYAAPSISKHLWENGQIGLICCDGTFTKARGFNSIILIAVTFDGNDQSFILAFAVVDVENSENWTWFKECLDNDFPGYTVWISDADKGIHSNSFALSMSQNEVEFVLSRCVVHLIKNIQKNFKGTTMNKKHKQAIVNLSRSKTEDVYNRLLEDIRSIDERWAAFIDNNKNQFVSYTFLD